MKDWSRAVAEVKAREVVAHAFRPRDVARWSYRADFDFVIILEGGEDVSAVPLGRGGGVAVLAMDFLGESSLVDHFFPKDCARGAVERDEGLGCFFEVSGGEINSFSGDDR